MIVSTFLILDKDDKKRFFEENFLFGNFKPNILLGMPFPTMNNADIDFQAKTYYKVPTLLKMYF